MSDVTYPAGQTGGTSATEKTQEKVQEAAGQTKEKAMELKDAAGSRVREQIDSRSTQAGEQLGSVAAAMRKTGEQMRSEGNAMPAKYVDQASERLERLGSYLARSDSDQLLREVEEFGRRRPWAVALAGGVVGLVAARFLKSSGRRRYEESAASGNGSGQAPMTPQYQEL